MDEDEDPMNDDAELIALCARLLANAAEEDRLAERHDPLADDADPATLDKSRDLSAEYITLRRQIAALPATTAEGRAAKARVALDAIGLDAEGNPLEPGGAASEAEPVAVSLFLDLIRGTRP